MWNVSSRSGVATLRTAIHLLLTYLLTFPAAQRHHRSTSQYQIILLRESGTRMRAMLIFIHRETVAVQKYTAIYTHKYKQNESNDQVYQK